MRSSGKILGLSLFTVALSVTSRAAQQNYGTGSSAVWALAGGTRALAVGDTAGLLAQDATVISYNPAALSLLGGGEAGLHHGSWNAGVTWDQASAVLPLSSTDAIGLCGAMASYGSFERKDDQGRSQGAYDANEALGAAGFSHRFGDLALGGSGFVTRQAIDQDATLGYAWSAGAIWQPLSKLSLAGALRSSNGGLASAGLEGDLGLALHSSGDHGQDWGLAVDSRYTSESSSELQVAATRGFRGAGGIDGQVLGAYRVSFAGNLDSSSSGHWSVGASLGWQAWALDYAFVPMGDLDTSHHVGLRYRFSGPKEEAPADPGPAPQKLVQKPRLAQPVPVPVPTPPSPRAVVVTSTVVLVLSDDVVRAQALESSDKLFLALEAYKAAVAADPSDLPAWKGLAKLHRRMERPAQSLRCWREVARLDPSDPDALAVLRAGQE
jgi:hypothetical protein